VEQTISMSKSEQKHILAKMQGLKSWEHRFIEMRYDGFPYKEIARILKEEYPHLGEDTKNKKISESWLRILLMDGGRLHEVYNEYESFMISESLKEGEKVLKSAHSLACTTLQALLNKNYPASVRLGAITELLDRNMGKARQKMEVHTEDMDYETKMKEIDKLMEEINENERKATETTTGKDSEGVGEGTLQEPEGKAV